MEAPTYTVWEPFNVFLPIFHREEFLNNPRKMTPDMLINFAVMAEVKCIGFSNSSYSKDVMLEPGGAVEKRAESIQPEYVRQARKIDSEGHSGRKKLHSRR